MEEKLTGFIEMSDVRPSEHGPGCWRGAEARHADKYARLRPNRINIDTGPFATGRLA
jgi:hypothetical protein